MRKRKKWEETRLRLMETIHENSLKAYVESLFFLLPYAKSFQGWRRQKKCWSIGLHVYSVVFAELSFILFHLHRRHHLSMREERGKKRMKMLQVTDKCVYRSIKTAIQRESKAIQWQHCNGSYFNQVNHNHVIQWRSQATRRK